MAIPASVPVDGTRRVTFLPAVADPEAVTVAEITAGTDLSCYLTGDGWAPSGDQAVVADSRLCSTQEFELGGRKTKSLTLRYVFNLNNADDDEARIALAEGTKGYLYHGLQTDVDDAASAGDFYELWPVTAGEPNVMPAEANAVDRIEQRMFVSGKVVKFAEVAGA